MSEYCLPNGGVKELGAVPGVASVDCRWPVVHSRSVTSYGGKRLSDQ